MPLRVNMAGVIPVIFAAAVMAFPPTIGQFFPQWQDFVNANFQSTSWSYLLLEAVLIVIFTYFYTAVQFNPVDQADNLRKYGGYIPGIRPGPADGAVPRPRAQRLTLPGALYLAWSRCRRALHPLLRLLAGDGPRARRHLGADRRRRRARHDATDGVADDDAPLRRLPEVAGMNILLLGPQGSGKGTQAKQIAADVRHPAHLDAATCPRAIARGTDARQQVEPILARGDLVPDEITIRADPRRLSRGDTTPASSSTASRATSRRRRRSTRCSGDRPAARRRLRASTFPTGSSSSSACSSARAEEDRTDDTPEAIAAPARDYQRETEPLVEHYRTRRGNVVGIHAERSVEDVFAEIRRRSSAVAARA